MPTTVFPDSSLSFKPDPNRPNFLQFQHTSDQNYSAAAQFYSSFTGGKVSSPECYSSDSTEGSHENSNSPLRSPDTTVVEDVQRGGAGAQSPFLRIVEEPIDKFRFRYITEMQGPHGAIMGEKSSGRRKSKSWPTVQLCNYTARKMNKEVIIRCTLATTQENVDERTTHVHRLICKRDGEEDDPVDVRVSDSSYKAEFKNMTIIYTKKPDQIEELAKKKFRHKLKLSTRTCSPCLPNKATYVEEAEREVKVMTKQILNQACLKFEALLDNGMGFYEPLCLPIYSRTICNMKSADFGDLKICKQSSWRGTCLGGDMVFLFVERVLKDNIKVKFFEMNEYEEVVWEAYGDFTPQDVHHQFGIVFQTPQYQRTDIENNVTVHFQLYRPSDQATSEPHEWEYKPHSHNFNKEVKRKKPSQNRTVPLFPQNAPFSPMIPTTVHQQKHVMPQQKYIAPQQYFTGPKPNSSAPDPSPQEIDIILNDLILNTKGLPNLDDLDKFLDEQMETEVTTSVQSSNPSLTDCLDRLITPDEEDTKEYIRDIISNEFALKKWASLNKKEEDFEKLMSEQTISSSGNQLDGMAFKQKRPIFLPRIEEVKVEKDVATHQMAVGPYTGPVCYTDHQSESSSKNRFTYAEHQMARTYEKPSQRLAQRLNRRAPTLTNPRFECTVVEPEMEAARTVETVGEPQMGKAVVVPEINEDNCIALMEKLVEKLNRLKMSGKLNDYHLRLLINKLFSYTMGDSGDTLFHVMVERYSHPFPNMQMFLNLAEEYQIQDVLDQINQNGEAPLHMAVRTGKFEIMVKLLESKANVDVRDGDNNTPLQLAVANGHVDMVQALMAEHPDLSVVNEEGNSVLHTAVISQNEEMISSLLVKQEGGSGTLDLLNRRDKKQGYTALHMAVAHRYIAGIKLLLRFADCNVNATNYSDVTPLGLVLESKFGVDREIAYLLIQNKADPSLVKVSEKEKVELKDDKAEPVEEENEEEDIDDDPGKYAREWNKDSKLFDETIVAELCSVLDRCNGWKQLLPMLNYSPTEVSVIGEYWSPTLMAFHLASSYKPEITLDMIRSAILKMPQDYDEAIRIIDNYMLTKLGL